MFGLLGDIFGTKKSRVTQNKQTSTFHSTMSESAPTGGNTIMKVDGVFEVAGKGVVVVGKILAGPVSVGDSVRIAGVSDPVTIDSIEAFNKQPQTVNTGDDAGLLFHTLKKDMIRKGTVIERVLSV